MNSSVWKMSSILANFFFLHHNSVSFITNSVFITTANAGNTSYFPIEGNPLKYMSLNTPLIRDILIKDVNRIPDYLTSWVGLNSQERELSAANLFREELNARKWRITERNFVQKMRIILEKEIRVIEDEIKENDKQVEYLKTYIEEGVILHQYASLAAERSAGRMKKGNDPLAAITETVVEGLRNLNPVCGDDTVNAQSASVNETASVNDSNAAVSENASQQLSTRDLEKTVTVEHKVTKFGGRHVVFLRTETKAEAMEEKMTKTFTVTEPLLPGSFDGPDGLIEKIYSKIEKGDSAWRKFTNFFGGGGKTSSAASAQADAIIRDAAKKTNKAAKQTKEKSSNAKTRQRANANAKSVKEQQNHLAFLERIIGKWKVKLGKQKKELQDQLLEKQLHLNDAMIEMECDEAYGITKETLSLLEADPNGDLSVREYVHLPELENFASLNSNEDLDELTTRQLFEALTKMRARLVMGEAILEGIGKLGKRYAEYRVSRNKKGTSFSRNGGHNGGAKSQSISFGSVSSQNSTISSEQGSSSTSVSRQNSPISVTSENSQHSFRSDSTSTYRSDSNFSSESKRKYHGNDHYKLDKSIPLTITFSSKGLKAIDVFPTTKQNSKNWYSPPDIAEFLSSKFTHNAETVEKLKQMIAILENRLHDRVLHQLDFQSAMLTKVANEELFVKSMFQTPDPASPSNTPTRISRTDTPTLEHQTSTDSNGDFRPRQQFVAQQEQQLSPASSPPSASSKNFNLKKRIFNRQVESDEVTIFEQFKTALQKSADEAMANGITFDFNKSDTFRLEKESLASEIIAEAWGNRSVGQRRKQRGRGKLWKLERWVGDEERRREPYPFDKVNLKIAKLEKQHKGIIFSSSDRTQFNEMWKMVEEYLAKLTQMRGEVEGIPVGEIGQLGVDMMDISSQINRNVNKGADRATLVKGIDEDVARRAAARIDDRAAAADGAPRRADNHHTVAARQMASDRQVGMARQMTANFVSDSDDSDSDSSSNGDASSSGSSSSNRKTRTAPKERIQESEEEREKFERERIQRRKEAHARQHRERVFAMKKKQVHIEALRDRVLAAKGIDPETLERVTQESASSPQQSPNDTVRKDTSTVKKDDDVVASNEGQGKEAEGKEAKHEEAKAKETKSDVKARIAKLEAEAKEEKAKEDKTKETKAKEATSDKREFEIAGEKVVIQVANRDLKAAAAARDSSAPRDSSTAPVRNTTKTPPPKTSTKKSKPSIVNGKNSKPNIVTGKNPIVTGTAINNAVATGVPINIGIAITKHQKALMETYKKNHESGWTSPKLQRSPKKGIRSTLPESVKKLISNSEPKKVHDDEPFYWNGQLVAQSILQISLANTKRQKRLLSAGGPKTHVKSHAKSFLQRTEQTKSAKQKSAPKQLAQPITQKSSFLQVGKKVGKKGPHLTNLHLSQEAARRAQQSPTTVSRSTSENGFENPLTAPAASHYGGSAAHIESAATTEELVSKRMKLENDLMSARADLLLSMVEAKGLSKMIEKLDRIVWEKEGGLFKDFKSK